MNSCWQEALNKFIYYLIAERNASPYTVRNYTRYLQDFFSFLEETGVGCLKDVDRHTWRAYSSHLMERGILKSSIASRQSPIRSFFRYLDREKMLQVNPLKKAPSPKQDRRLPQFLTVEEARRFVETPDLSTPEGQRDRALLEMLYASGLRVSELVNLNMENLRMDFNEIRVWGKGSKERMVLMGQPAAEALSAYLREGRPRLLGEKKNSAVFLTSYKDEDGIHYGERLLVRRVQKILEKYAKNIDKRVHPHMLRHTFATHLLNGEADLRVVQELLGHSSLSSTQIYTHVSKSQARKIYLSAHPMAQKKNDENE